MQEHQVFEFTDSPIPLLNPLPLLSGGGDQARGHDFEARLTVPLRLARQPRKVAFSVPRDRKERIRIQLTEADEFVELRGIEGHRRSRCRTVIS